MPRGLLNFVGIMHTPFSRRHGYRPKAEITIREDAPPALRIRLLQILHDEIGLTYNQIRHVICYALRTFPNPHNWSEIPNIRDEVFQLLGACPWYLVYDVIEAFYRFLREPLSMLGAMIEKVPGSIPLGGEQVLAARINELFEEEGIGWQLMDGQVVSRGSEQFERTVGAAISQADEAGYQTVRMELEEARRSLSRRPKPDSTGAVQRCMAGLECLARILSGDEKATLGDIIKRHAAKLGIPKPLDGALEKLWGYASEMGRHLREGRVPSREEAELLLSVVAALVVYLLQKHSPREK